jgi:tryptophanyl-tRNA synthetase
MRSPRRAVLLMGARVGWMWCAQDDEELQKIGEEYKSGRMLTGEIKAKLIEVVQAMVAKHQERRATISPDEVATFFSTDKRSPDDLFG